MYASVPFGTTTRTRINNININIRDETMCIVDNTNKTSAIDRNNNTHVNNM